MNPGKKNSYNSLKSITIRGTDFEKFRNIEINFNNTDVIIRMENLKRFPPKTVLVPSSSRPRTPACHAGNTGSNPVGTAIKEGLMFKILLIWTFILLFVGGYAWLVLSTI